MQLRPVGLEPSLGEHGGSEPVVGGGLAVQLVAVLEGNARVVGNHLVLSRLLEEENVGQRNTGELLEARPRLHRVVQIELLLVDEHVNRVLGSHDALLAVRDGRRLTCEEEFPRSPHLNVGTRLLTVSYAVVSLVDGKTERWRNRCKPNRSTPENHLSAASRRTDQVSDLLPGMGTWPQRMPNCQRGSPLHGDAPRCCATTCHATNLISACSRGACAT